MNEGWGSSSYMGIALCWLLRDWLDLATVLNTACHDPMIP
jgi:hypothetical protein